MSNDLYQKFLSILRDRDVPYDRDAIKAAFNDPDSEAAIQAWIEEYLTPETLLTRDEAALYATLLKNGQVETLAAEDLSVVQGLDDQEIQNAIEELKRSTAAIEKQTEALRLQQNAMASLVKNDKRTHQTRAHTEKGQVRKWDVEKGHINAAVEELSQSLKYQILDLEQQSKASEAGVKQTVDNILKSDDKLLLSLQKLASDLDPVQSEDDDVIARIRELCARLIKHTVEGIRTRLDRIYLENLNLSTVQNGHDSDDQEVNDLQEELESLYSEILPVAQMSAEQQYLEPALRTIAATNGQGQERSVKAVKYIHDCLIFLVNRIETFLERMEESQCHKMALQFVLDSAKKELSLPEPSTIKPASPTKSNTQRRRKSSSSQTSPIRARTTRRRSSGHDEDVEPEQQLARNLGIALPAEATARVEALEKLLSERIARLESHSNSLQSTTETSISSHLLDAQITLGLLQDSLLAKTPYGKVRLIDPKIESGVSKFDQEVQGLQKGLDAIELHALQAKNVSREQLVERWSR
ncbi:hypothetical protein V8E51_016064 [Hyaloscypha variabilis]